ncbi:gamma-glutamylcyclotransferase [Mesobaculum littorinae]|uniref:glutathione-specific gamma-glutamylcyclotransferase n=1 Tax=Mesobaculum littorinae TaxID=2486419 RepID=A0A438AEC2_9RHOB|nr:gamma-glutamylcyclotransferase [Mesobaculum littorinae]RVV96975.1 gamma-glutamylcyclotransferase [Mesobaculum littorinae]
MWVFGYGSLIWNPGFPEAERIVATLPGYARSFCMRSIHHRGSVETPGLVLALAEAAGDTCTGLAFRVEEGAEEVTLTALRERELISSAYLERHVTLDLVDGRQVEALAYVIDPAHVQYCELELDEQARIIAHAHGGRGPNAEYLYNTAEHLADLGIGDEALEWLAARVRDIEKGGASDSPV